MKREIICLKCEKELKELHGSANPYPGEHLRYVEGKAVDDYVCDQCGISIKKDSLCCCYSIYTDYGGQPYYGWEEEYINLNI